MINKTSIQEAYEWFCEFIEAKQGTPFTSFSEGLMNYEEGYKEDVYKKAQEILELKRWKRADIGKGEIIDRVVQAMKASYNIVNYHAITRFKDIANKKKKQSESILYDLYKKSNSKDAFEKACGLWGRRWNELSYIMFTKDKDKYVPIRATIHKKIFESLDLPTDFFKDCSWENYQEYLQIMYEIREYLEDLFDLPVSLLDAHSFVWRVGRDEAEYVDAVKKIKEEKKDDETNRKLANGIIDLEKKIERTKCERKPLKNSKTNTQRHTYRRSDREVKEALDRANYKCEINKGHKTFKRKKDGLPYTETHHLIPMCYQDRFENSLDNWPNIVSLCSHCHNQIHYGKDAEELIRQLYKERKPLLKKAGINISIKELLKMYK